MSDTIKMPDEELERALAVEVVEGDLPSPVVADAPAASSIAEGVEIAERYRLQRRIGSGAFAEVWQALDRRMGREVALKIFTAQGARDPAAMAVLREAQATAQIVSDHVIRVYNTFIDEARGVAVIEMELCREGDELGAPLDTKLRPERGAETLEEVRQFARWTYQAAIGVHDAHVQNVFQRDLKPQNILVRPKTLRCQVLDFGLAAHHVTPSAAGGGADFSRHGDTVVSARADEDGVNYIAGTPDYMAPEQARGIPFIDVSRPEQRAVLVGIDVYGLGAVLFELLTGVAPHAGGEDGTLLRAMSNVVPWTLLDRKLIPKPLAQCVRKAMATDPRQRYQNVEVFAEQLRRFLAHEPTEWEETSYLARAVLARRRNPAVASAALGVAVLLAAAIYLGLTVRAAERRLVEARTAIAEVEQRRAQLEQEGLLTKQQLNETSNALARRVTDAKAERERLQKEIADQGQAGDKLQRERKLLEADLKLKVAELALKEQDLKTKQQELEASQKALGEKQKELDGKQQELQQTRQELGGKVKELEGKQKELEGKQKELDEAKAAIATLEAANQKLQAELEAAKAAPPPPPPVQLPVVPPQPAPAPAPASPPGN